MNKFLLIVFSTLIFHLLSHAQTPIIQSVINQTNIDSLTYFVQELSGEVQTIISGSPYTIQARSRYQPVANDKAADYIKQKLDSYGLATFNQTGWSSTGRNVYGVQLGTTYPNKQYIICAHYDDRPTGTIAPGADDNASGTAAVLEAARIISKYNSEYTIIFALWDEEEDGLLGSDYYAQQASLSGDSIMGVVNLDMIAWDSDNNSIADLHTRSVGTSLFLKDKMVEVNTMYNLGLTIDIKNPGSTSSDHASFWYYNFGAILLIEDGTDFNAYYHTVNDLIQYFNLPYFLKMSKSAIGTVATLAVISEIVPVELLAFTASINNSKIQLLWSTASELNNLGFEIQRSVDNPDNFVTVGFVEGKGNSTEINHYTFTDNPKLNGVNQLYFRLRQVDFDGSFSLSNVVNVTYDVPTAYVLNQNFPNPFNPSTRINYFVPRESFVSIKVYDFLGREVKTLVNDIRPTGSYEILFDASELTSGTYFYNMTADNYSNTKKMIILK